jgi:3,4-dihydroxy 2-butanone 4-phosphate synthase/GTP cyclohydrolase II
MISSIELAIEDLKNGKMIIVCDDEDRENEGDLVMAADFVTPEAVNFMAKEGRGLICVPLESEFTDRLDLALTQKVNSSKTDCNFTTSVDLVEVTTGISAAERAMTIKKLADPNSRSVDFRRPGHVFPLRSKKGGVLVRQGHTEAAVDLARLSGLNPAGVICEIMNDDGSMARMPELVVFAEKHDLKIITIKDLVAYRYKADSLVHREVEVEIPTAFGDLKIYAYSNEIDAKDHLAITSGDFSFVDAPNVRIHSECFTGDVLLSAKCDCVDQLHSSLEYISKNGGIVLYMRQEGRGIGLINKLKAYKLQNQGYDTVEANEKLGFPDDLRDYGLCAQILKNLGIKKIKLMTNNPRKIEDIESRGISVVQRLPLEVPLGKNNINYMQVKKVKLGHLLDSL